MYSGSVLFSFNQPPGIGWGWKSRYLLCRASPLFNKTYLQGSRSEWVGGRLQWHSLRLLCLGAYRVLAAHHPATFYPVQTWSGQHLGSKASSIRQSTCQRVSPVDGFPTLTVLSFLCLNCNLTCCGCPVWKGYFSKLASCVGCICFII